MNITSAQYIDDFTGGGQHVSIKATIDGEEVTVPIDTGNRHYDEIQRQVAAGTLTIADAD
jgi:hypothetical protein